MIAEGLLHDAQQNAILKGDPVGRVLELIGRPSLANPIESPEYTSVDDIHELFYESMLDTVIYARDKWLRPGGYMLPETQRDRFVWL